MNIENLVRSAVFSLATACSACGDTYYNNRDSEENTTATGYSDPAREICEEFIDCCHHVTEENNEQKICLVHFGGKVDTAVSDCMNYFNSSYSLEYLKCIAPTFSCTVEDNHLRSISWKGCN